MVLYGALDKAPFKAPAEGAEGEEGMERRGSSAGAAERDWGRKGGQGAEGARVRGQTSPGGDFIVF